MKTINGVLLFLRKLDLVANLERAEFKNFNCIKKVLANDFRDLNTEKLINMLIVVDDIYIYIYIYIYIFHLELKFFKMFGH